MKTENHRRLTALACGLVGIEPEYSKLMAVESMKPDVFDDYYIALGGTELDYFSSRTYLHLYDPVHDYGGAPLECLRYTILAKDAFNDENIYDGYSLLGYASHYLQDPATPVHTDMDIIDQIQFHLAYEDWINLHWIVIEKGLSLNPENIINCEYIQKHIRTLAYASNEYITRVWDAMRDNNQEELYNITVTCVRDAIYYTAGFYKYFFATPEIIEEYKAPVSWLSLIGSSVLIGLAWYGGYKLITRRKK